MNLLKIWVIICSIFCVTSSCCPGQKQTKQPAAKDALPDRNTRDPKLKNTAPQLELMDTSKVQESESREN